MSEETPLPEFSHDLGNKDARLELARLIVSIREFDIGMLTRPNLHQFNFQELVPLVSSLQKMCDCIHLPTLDMLSEELDGIRTKASNYWAKLSLTLAFDPAAGPENQSPLNRRNELTTDVRNAANNVRQHLFRLLVYSATRNLKWQDIDESIKESILRTFTEFENHVENMKADVDRHRNRISAIRDEAEQALSAVQGQVAVDAAMNQAEHFEQLADKHNTDAATWLKHTLIAGGVLVVFSLLSIVFGMLGMWSGKTTGDAIQILGGKALVFATLSYFLYLCGRTYVTHNHNAVVNSHRANALKTYRAIVEAAGDEPNRNAVLIQAASCIFSPQPTGFSNSESGEGISQKSVIELLSKNVSSSSS